jgi:hypothetical protein
MLGLKDKKTIGKLDFMYRFGGFHRLKYSYSVVKRSGTASIANDIVVGYKIFQAGTVVNSKNESETMRLSYGYSVLRDNQKELGITAGLHRTRLETSITSTITGELESNRADPILPTIGSFGSVVIGPRTRVDFEAQFFRLDYDRYEGALNYVRVELLRELGHVGLGIGYSYYWLRLDSTNRDFMGAVEFRHRGTSASLSLQF